jgi:NAD(P)-dependent dehydrogenase (short-subunit alcohol dehydrogenase family)
VVVMGASSGIGRETALRLAREGARVVVSARGAEALGSLVDAIHAAGGQAVSVPAEVTDPEQVRAVADRAVAEYGGLDTWVHLSGVGLWAKLEDTTPEEWARVVDVNLNGQAYGAMAALPHLKREGRGALILVSSGEARFALPYQAAYSASKHGISGLAQALRVELMKEGCPVSVTEVMPSGINTPLFDRAKTKIGSRPQPMPPFYQPSLVADAILYAAEHAVPEMVVGGSSQLGIMAQSLAPRLLDLLWVAAGFKPQHREPKSSDAPSNLFEPLPGGDQVEGTLAHPRSTSVYTWLETHPTVRRTLAVAAVGAVAVLAARTLINSRDGSEAEPEPPEVPVTEFISLEEPVSRYE